MATSPPLAQHDHHRPPAGSPMRVRKRDGSYEPVDVNRIVRAVQRCAHGLDRVDPLRVATRTISGLCDGSTTAELDALAIRTAASLVVEEPEYSWLAARLLGTTIDKEVRGQGIDSFSRSVVAGAACGLVSPATADFVATNRRELDAEVDRGCDLGFELFGLRTIYDRYLLRHPSTRLVLETPEYFLLRVACGLASSAAEAVQWYRQMAAFDWLPSSPTLFNSGTTHPQLSSCYLLDSPPDDLGAIYDTYKSVAQLSKHAGGIGLAFHRVRSRGSLIAGTNGLSNGVVPFLKTLDASVAAVNQGGRRKGACCVYLESWHADIEDFLDLRDNTGEESRRTHHLNLANWVPDLFMRRVEKDWIWSLFDPAEVPELCDLHGEEFDRAYQRAEEQGRAVRQVRARVLYGRMMRTLAQTGNGWMTFKDAANRGCNQAAEPANVVHLSNLCTEILQVTDADNTAVCNLASVNLARFVTHGGFDLDRLGRVVKVAVGFLDRVIDANFYPTAEARRSNLGWRPVGLGMMGLQDVFFALRLPFDGPEARGLSTAIAEEIYLSALECSAELAAVHGAHPRYHETWAHRGRLAPDLAGIRPPDSPRWSSVRARIREVGLRNSLLVAVAPTATIASIAGCYECVEPQVSNLFKRETLSGEFLQVNRHLVRDLQRMGRWDDAMRAELVAANGSVQGVAGLSDDMRALYRTAWELPMRSVIDMAADRVPFVDQSQSVNLFVEQPTIETLSSMYMHAWKQGLKTTYYLRSRPASRITANRARPGTCSPESPETCEACE